MAAFSRTWHLYKESFAVLSQDGEILLFPVLSGISTVLLAAGFFIPLYREGMVLPLLRGKATWDQYLGVFSWFYLNNFLIVFFNTALIGCANIRFSGGVPSVAAGLRLALARTPSIAVWAFVSSALSLVFGAFNTRRSWLLRSMSKAASLTWTMVTYLIVPVLIVEDRGIFSSLERSRELFRRQWGEQLIGTFGFGLLNTLLLAPGFLAGMALWRFDRAGAVIVGLTYALFLAMISSAVSGVFKAALYRFAATGQVPPGFTANALNPSHASFVPDDGGSGTPWQAF